MVVSVYERIQVIWVCIFVIVWLLQFTDLEQQSDH